MLYPSRQAPRPPRSASRRRRRRFRGDCLSSRARFRSFFLSVTRSFCHTLSLSLSLFLSYTFCHSLFLSVARSFCHSLSVILSPRHSLSLSLSLFLSHTFCHSLSQPVSWVSLSRSLAPSLPRSLALSLSLGFLRTPY